MKAIKFAVRVPSKKNKRKVSLVLLATQIIKNLKSWKINKALKDDYVVVKFFSGATSKCMLDYVKPAIRQKPDRFVIHVGTNDLKSNETANQICKNIMDLAKECKKDTDIPVVISSIIERKDHLNGKVESVNAILESMCNSNNFEFLDNQNIKNIDLNGSNVHLNKHGNEKLTNNIVEYIEKN